MAKQKVGTKLKRYTSRCTNYKCKTKYEYDKLEEIHRECPYCGHDLTWVDNRELRTVK